MPGIVHSAGQLSTVIEEGIGRAGSQNIVSKQGAVMLLILLVAFLGYSLLVWNLANAEQHTTLQAQPLTSSAKRIAPTNNATNEPAINNPESTANTSRSASVINNGSSDVSTQVEVNGQPIAVPQNGSVHKEVVSDDGSKTTVDINVNSSTDAASARSHSSFNMNMNTSQSSSKSQEGP
jgi:hypothetical protein